MFDGAGPIGYLDIDGFHAKPMSLSIFDENRRRVKAHWLVIQDGACERRQVFHLEVCRGICDEREASSVGLRKSIQRERADVLYDRGLRLLVQAVRCHTCSQLA